MVRRVQIFAALGDFPGVWVRTHSGTTLSPGFTRLKSTRSGPTPRWEKRTPFARLRRKAAHPAHFTAHIQFNTQVSEHAENLKKTALAMFSSAQNSYSGQLLEAAVFGIAMPKTLLEVLD